MSTRRSAMGVAVLGEHVYIIGGYDGLHSLNSVEMYAFVYNAFVNMYSTIVHVHLCTCSCLF